MMITNSLSTIVCGYDALGSGGPLLGARARRGWIAPVFYWVTVSLNLLVAITWYRRGCVLGEHIDDRGHFILLFFATFAVVTMQLCASVLYSPQRDASLSAMHPRFRKTLRIQWIESQLYRGAAPTVGPTVLIDGRPVEVGPLRCVALENSGSPSTQIVRIHLLFRERGVQLTSKWCTPKTSFDVMIFAGLLARQLQCELRSYAAPNDALFFSAMWLLRAPATSFGFLGTAIVALTVPIGIYLLFVSVLLHVLFGTVGVYWLARSRDATYSERMKEFESQSRAPEAV